MGSLRLKQNQMASKTITDSWGAGGYNIATAVEAE